MGKSIIQWFLVRAERGEGVLVLLLKTLFAQSDNSETDLMATEFLQPRCAFNAVC